MGLVAHYNSSELTLYGRNRAANVMKLVEGRTVMLNSRKTTAGEKTPAKTLVSVKRQGDFLQVNFQCTEPFMDKTVAVKRQFDDPGTFRDNEVEFLINPSGDRKNYYHFVINSIGCLTDYRCVSVGKRPQSHIAWNSNAKVQVNRSGHGFDIELSIPMKSLKGFKINSATVNFGRSRNLEKVDNYTQMYVLSPQGDGFHDIENFYRLVEPAKELFYDGSFNSQKQIDANGKRIWRLKNHVAWTQFNTKESFCTLDDKVFYTAPYSLKIVSGNSKGNFVWFTLPKLKPNTRYRLSAMVKMENVVPDNAKGGFTLILRDNNNRFFPNSHKPQGTSNWFALCSEFVTDMLAGNAPDTRVLPRLLFASGTVWVDDLSLEELD